MNDFLSNIIRAHKSGTREGIYSVCSSNEFVLEASMQQARQDNSPLLIESTSNQVNQFGGYTGLNPAQFYKYTQKIAERNKFPTENLMLGGDHLGPNPWQNEDTRPAMEKAVELIRSYVASGYRKIHLDTSMRCADDPGAPDSPFSTDIIAERAAELCGVAEETARKIPGNHSLPVYVIGTDVPVPGGAKEKIAKISPTPVDEVENTIRITKDAFYKKGLEAAWQRVIAIVVQPGVEFDDSSVFGYNRENAAQLSQFIEQDNCLVYEAHSTDYQSVSKLTEMVEDHFVILKVGPALTFSFREAVFGLAHIEKELLHHKKAIKLSNILEIIEDVMTREPQYWEKHYHGTEAEKLFARKYSFSDRIRYYWPHRDISVALNILINNLTPNPIPLTLLSQFLPNQYQAVRNGEISNKPKELIQYHIRRILKDYAESTRMNKNRNF